MRHGRVYTSFASAQQSAPETVSITVTAVPVSPFIDTIFYVRARSGSFSPEARAAAIAQRIQRVAEDVFFHTDSLVEDSSKNVFDLHYGDRILVSGSAKDAELEGTDQRHLVRRYSDAIGKSIQGHRAQVGWKELLKQILLAILVLGSLVLIIRLVSRLFHRTSEWLAMQTGSRIEGLKIRDYELLSAERSVSAVQFVNNVLKWVVVLFALYLAFPVIFGIFPWTRGLTDTLLGYVLGPLQRIGSGTWEFMPNLITIVVIIVAFRYVLKGLAFLRGEVERGVLQLPGFYPDWAALMYQLIRVMIVAFMIVVIFPYLPGSDSPIFKGVTVFLGALFTFGSAGSLSNLIAGLVLTYMRAFQVGDRVRIGDVFGDIIERNMLVTRVRTIKNEIISIPNSTVVNNHTTNYSSDAPANGLIIHTTVTIGYDAPWRRLHELLIAAAKGTDLIEVEPEPYVLQRSLDDFYVSYEINAFTKHPNKQALIYSELHQNIQDQFNTAGVEIMSPHYRHSRDGNESTIPTKE